MAWAEAPYAKAQWAGYASIVPQPPNQVLPPPIPGGTVAYFRTSRNGMYPYAYATYAMGTPAIPVTYGGVVAIPNPDLGVMEIRAWWPGAAVIHVVRVHDDDTRHPVRGGYGLTVVGSTRTNYTGNPSFEAGLNGVVPDAGTPTLTRIDTSTDPTVPFGLYALRATIASGGSDGIVVPTTPPGTVVTAMTVGFSARFSARPTGVRVVVSWTDGVGTPLTTNTVNITAAAINNTVNQFGRLVATLTPPANAVTPTVKIIGDGLPAGGTMDIDGVTVETATTDGSQFDGNTLGGSWAGTKNLSTSSLAPIQTLYDGEAPLDVPVTYMVANPAITGGQVESSVTSLNSVGRFCWLTHPMQSSTPLRVDLQSVPVLEHGIDQGVFYPVGSTRAVVVSGRRRQPSTTLVFNANSFDDRDAILDLAADGMPLLLRAPAHYGYGVGRWWSLAAIIEDREGRRAYQDAMILTAQAVAVQGPSPALVFEGAA